jgi:cytochrome c oxidase subunit II
MIVAIVFFLVAVGSVLFHLMSPWWWTPIASNWSYIDHTIILTFWITGTVFVAVIGFMAYCVWRYRGGQAEYAPENKKLEAWLTVLTSIGVAGMLAPGLLVWHDFISVPNGAPEFEVVGQQWQWSFRLPGQDGALGAAETRNVSDTNALGINPDDPKGKDDVVIVADELHLPVGRPVKVLLRSIDVLHDFYVPEFRAKMDMIPGMVTYFWFQPTRTGSFEALCAELCGVGHHAMRGKVVVENEDDYQKWLKGQKTFEQAMAASGKTKLAKSEAGADDHK